MKYNEYINTPRHRRSVISDACNLKKIPLNKPQKDSVVSDVLARAREKLNRRLGVT